MAAVIRRYSELLHSRIGVRGVSVDHRTALLLHDWGSIGEEKKRGTGQVNFLSFPQETCPRLSNSLVFLHNRHPAVELLGKRYAMAERVVSATEFRENADECMDWARTAPQRPGARDFPTVGRDLASGRCPAGEQATAGTCHVWNNRGEDIAVAGSGSVSTVTGS
jgi:hypothetical protein